MTTPDPDALDDIVARCRSATGPDRGIDVLLWQQIGTTQGGDEDAAWRKHLPLSPDMVVNAMTMHEAVRQYPHDMDGIARSWNVPRITASRDAAEMLLGEPEDPFVWTTQCDFGGLRRCNVYDGHSSFLCDAASVALATAGAAAGIFALRSRLGRPQREQARQSPGA